MYICIYGVQITLSNIIYIEHVFLLSHCLLCIQESVFFILVIRAGFIVCVYILKILY